MSEEIKLPNGLRYMTDKPPREQLQRLADCVRVQEREALMRETDCSMILREWDARDAELATAEADCAAMRQSLGKLVSEVEQEMGDSVQLEQARAALTRHTGQAILDELSAARKVMDAKAALDAWRGYGMRDLSHAEQQRQNDSNQERAELEAQYLDALDAYRAARKANTGDKQ